MLVHIVKLEYSWKLVAAIIALLFIAFVAYVLLVPPKPAVTTFYQEPLLQASSMNLLSGEKYTYLFGNNSTEKSKIENAVGEQRGDCLMVTTTFSNNSIPFCIDSSGNSKLPTGGNSSISPDFLQAWMLAVKEGWNWSMRASTTVEFAGGSEEFTASANYAYAGTEKFKGRDAYKVEVIMEAIRISNGKEAKKESSKETIWVDAEKRVLLYRDSPGFEMEIIGAPFPLTSTSKS
jgi:hypothetical protein